MNLTAHPVTPEDVMAFLDGELSAAEVQAVSAHLDECSECAKILSQFHSLSRSLSEWAVETAPAKLETSIANSISKVDSTAEIGKSNFFIRTSFWTWKQWAVAGGGAMALLLVAAISIPNLERSRARAGVANYYDRQLDTDGAGRAGKLGQRGAGYVTLAPPGPMRNSTSPYDLAGRDKSTRGDQITDEQRDNSDQDYSYSPAPMIARTVSLSIVVKDFTASRSLLDTVLARHHGYFGQLNISTPENAAQSLQASLRIPAQELTSALADLKKFGRVVNESQSGEEVTQQHADLVARLKTSRETEQRFRAILQQRTGKVSDVLQVEEGIARVRGDIERMEAEQKDLEHRVNFATVELQLTEEYKAQLSPPAASISTRIHNAFVSGYQDASETVLGIVLFFIENGPALLIWLAILAVPFILVWRRYRKLVYRL
jgi:hypothetical protein